jgi:alpha-galactosidase
MPVFGCCHGIQGTSHILAARAGVPYEEMVWECAGINHLAWFTKLEHNGLDLYPRLMRQARADVNRALRKGPARRYKRISLSRWDIPGYEQDLIRKDMMLHFGAFMTEGSGHFSEYIPYYRKRADLLKKYARPGYAGGSSFYADNWPKWRAAADRGRSDMVRGKEPIGWPRTWEYASWIVEAREKNSPVRVHLNVMNQHHGGGPLISNLMYDGCVEVACMVNRNGVQPTVYGRLPANMAALCESNMRVFDLGANAAIHKSVELAIQALTLDPLTAAVCSPAEIKKMTLELFAAEKNFLKAYR